MNYNQEISLLEVQRNVLSKQMDEAEDIVELNGIRESLLELHDRITELKNKHYKEISDQVEVDEDGY